MSQAAGNSRLDFAFVLWLGNNAASYLLVTELLVFPELREVALAEDGLEPATSVKTHDDPIKPKVKVAAHPFMCAARWLGDFLFRLAEPCCKRNRIEDCCDDLIQPVRIIITGVRFGDFAAIYDKRLRERRRLNRAPAFFGSDPVLLNFSMAVGLRIDGFANRKLDMKRRAARKRQLRFSKARSVASPSLMGWRV